MNVLLQGKLDALESYAKHECWYLVKQETRFEKVCYLVSFLEKFQNTHNPDNKLAEYISEQSSEMSAQRKEVFESNYRALRVAAFYGLIIMKSAKYEDAEITDTFREIKERCNGDFENTSTYADIIERQIEKMFVASEIDRQSGDIRSSFRLYPVMLVYKILLDLGRSTGDFSISYSEYKYLVATSREFEDFLDTLLLIKLFREDNSSEEKFKVLGKKFDNRMNQALQQLPALHFSNDRIRLVPDKIDEIAEKIFIFEQNPRTFNSDDYVEFLGSTKSLFSLRSPSKLSSMSSDPVISRSIDIPEEERVRSGENVLLYGVPGSGKSWTIQNEYCGSGSIVERVVFHPDYTYSDFVGQILPVVTQSGQVSYAFTAGPFTKILKEAYENPTCKYTLIIEEINRGNAPAIFGEIFQLLDRKTEDNAEIDLPKGTSEYGITNSEIAETVYGDPSRKVRIPSNLSLIGTMNTSDQNVFTLDTAFQRRWEMRLIENDFDLVDPKLAEAEILDTAVTWRVFCTAINSLIASNNQSMPSAEDKRMGAYFIRPSDLKFDNRMDASSISHYRQLKQKAYQGELIADDDRSFHEMRDAVKQNSKFSEKVIKYLWDDAFRFDRGFVFDIANLHSLEEVNREFLRLRGPRRFDVFQDNVKVLLGLSRI